MSLTPQFGSLIPSSTQEILNSNYLQFNTGAAATGGDTFAQQYLPEIYEQEVERYGNRTLSGFLRMVGAEMPMTSDQVIWSEQNRLHVGYDNVDKADNAAGTVFTVQVPLGAAPNEVVVRINQSIVVFDPASGLTLKGLVTATANDATPAPGTFTFTAVCYTAATFGALGNSDLKVFVYGSDFAKGTEGMIGSVTPQVTQFSNRPIIIKDKYFVNGSDTAQIGWIEVATEDGTSGYLWYMKAESETRLRYEDYLEMAMVEGEKATAASGVTVNTAANNYGTGTEGLFASLNARGNVYSGFAGAAAPGAGALGDFDAILQQLDLQGAIEENMLFLDRATALDFDDMIAAQAGGGFASTQSASYGLFDNESEMALNFGFSGFRRGSYDFYKTDWKYLNDASTRGMVTNIKGVLVPAGTSTVYDQMLGSNIRRPFLHVRYRASETDDRRMKSWITGSVGGAYTSSLDAMEVHYLSERCLVTQAANNFVLFTS